MVPAPDRTVLLPAIAGTCLEVLGRPPKLPPQLGVAGLPCSAPASGGSRSRSERAAAASPQRGPLPPRSGSALRSRSEGSRATGHRPSPGTASEADGRPRAVSRGPRSLSAYPPKGAASQTDRCSPRRGYPPRARPEAEAEAVAAARPPPGAAREGKLLYVVQFGNNSSLLRQILRSRPAWQPGPGDPGNPAGKTVHEEKRVTVGKTDDLLEFHFLWTQYPQKQFLSAMASRQPGICVTLNEEVTMKMKIKKKPQPRDGEDGPVRVHNHFEGNNVLTQKAGLRETMVQFYLRHGRDPFGAVPLTFTVRKGSSDEQFVEWRRVYEAISEATKQRMWLVKPGTNANRGMGIRFYDTAEEIEARVDSKERVWVVQKYMEQPLLVHKRKFDIRAYCLVTQEPGGGTTRAYFFREAYLRTASVKYSLKTKDKMAHLNNDAVQKDGEDYGKFESANKLSLPEFQRYLDEHHARDKFSVEEQLVPQIRGLMADTIRAAGEKLNPRGISHCFEVFGFDFMVDASFRCWLIEVNSNPCLELCNSYLSYLIPRMLEEAMQMTVDRIFPQGGSAGGGGAAEGAVGGWQPIYSSDGADEVSCEWVERLPEGSEGPPDFALLGRSLLEPPRRRKAAKKSSERAPA